MYLSYLNQRHIIEHHHPRPNLSHMDLLYCNVGGVAIAIYELVAQQVHDWSSSQQRISRLVAGSLSDISTCQDVATNELDVRFIFWW